MSEISFSKLSSETIVALATPPGRGGVAIVRISGPAVKSIMFSILECQLAPREACYLPFKDENKAILDLGIAIFFSNPHSFTGEDVLELHGHGGPIVVDLLIQRILRLGARMARPGEFSERAFLNGKIDLAQAEAIADLIDAASKEAAQSALRSLQGEFSREIEQLNEQLIYIRMYIEAAIDFSDEEIDFLHDEKIISKLMQLRAELSSIQAKAKQGSFLREGIQVAIIGSPNVGKSSLINCLSGNEIAIVTDIPGTTRDILRDTILIDGIPIHIIDTAGLRESDDLVEQEGVRRAYKAIGLADLILYVLDANDADSLDLKQLPQELTSKPILIIYNKIDLLNKTSEVIIQNSLTSIFISAKKNEGIVLLKEQIKQFIGVRSSQEGVYSARRRHLDALERAYQLVESCIHQLSVNASELAAEELRLAQLALNEITGEFSSDDLLGRIFASFCIGK